MIGNASSIIRFFLLILVCWHICLVAASAAVPVFRDQSKKSYRDTARYQKKSPPVRTLGRYGDISSVKYSGNSGKKLSGLRPGSISAKSVIVIDALNGRTLFSRSPDTPRQPASTIKVITGMIAIDSLKNKERVPVSNKAARQPRSKVYLDPRKTYSANDLINAVLLASANDASVALAEKIAGSEKSFARLMTSRARAWGARSTICKTASGLTAKGQKTTARDLATIFRKAMNNKEFASRMKRTKIRTTEGKLLRNHNKALWQIDGALAGKTGYTNAARQTYVGKFKRGRREIILAIMGSESMWTDIKRLVSYSFSRKGLASTLEPETDDQTLLASSGTAELPGYHSPVK